MTFINEARCTVPLNHGELAADYAVRIVGGGHTYQIAHQGEHYRSSNDRFEVIGMPSMKNTRGLTDSSDSMVLSHDSCFS